MRKNKSKVMAFSLLALCVACLAFGVYALKHATLTVSGTVGFTAHDCMVNVKAFIEGDGLTEAGVTTTDAAPSAERALNFKDINTNEVTVGGASEDEWDKEVALNDVIYFTDLTDDGSVAPITITFRLTNLSVYDVYATIANMEDLTAKGVSIEVSDEVVMQEANESTTDEAVLTAVFTLDTTKVTDAGLMEGFELKLDFGKHVVVENGGEEEGGEEVTPAYLTGMPQTASEIVAMFEGTEFQAVEVPEEYRGVEIAGLTGMVSAINTETREQYSFYVFESVEAFAVFLTGDDYNTLEEVATASNTEGVVYATYVVTAGGGGEVNGPSEG